MPEIKSVYVSEKEIGLFGKPAITTEMQKEQYWNHSLLGYKYYQKQGIDLFKRLVNIFRINKKEITVGNLMPIVRHYEPFQYGGKTGRLYAVKGFLRGITGLDEPEIKTRFTGAPVIVPPEHNPPVGAKWAGKAWRAESGYTPDRGATALDVVNFEADELGNEDTRTQALSTGIDLSKIPADDVVWVGEKKSGVSQYTAEGRVPITKVDLPKHAVVLADDGEGGYLVYRGDKKLTMRNPNPNAKQEFDFIMDTRFSATPKADVIRMTNELEKSIFDKAILTVYPIRELLFGDVVSYRRHFVIGKRPGYTWNDLYAIINKIQAPVYKRINPDNRLPAKSKVPWGWLGLGVLTVGGIIYYIKTKGAEPAPQTEPKQITTGV